MIENYSRPHNTVEYKFDTVQSIIDFNNLSMADRYQIYELRISKDQIMQIKNTLELEVEIFGPLLGVVERTVYIKKGKELFGERITNAVLALVELYSFGYNIFSNPKHFNLWMRSLSFELDSKTPLDHCHHFIGREEVKKQILRLKEKYQVL